MAIDRSVRRSQTISPFGTGAIYDLGAESFVAMDTTRWPKDAPKISLPRMEEALGVNGFRTAPVAGDAAFPGGVRRGQTIEYSRFPAWLFCPAPACRAMVKWNINNEENGKAPRCDRCSKKVSLVPMRFIAVCKSGHLMDVPWVRWAHSGKNKTDTQHGCRNPKLEFISSSDRGAGLQSLIVHCKNCGAENDLERLPQKNSLKGMFKCSGNHPWEFSNPDSPAACDQTPQVVQRGASNAYYPSVVSAIDIRAEHDSEDDLLNEIRKEDDWQGLIRAYSFIPDIGNPLIRSYLSGLLANEKLIKLGVTEDTIYKILVSTEETVPENSEQASNDNDLLADEWKAFINPPLPNPKADFLAEVVDLDAFDKDLPSKERAAWAEFRKLISQVTLARKLRIVRALTGFNRLEPDNEKITSPSLGAQTGWLPAVEIFGEGIFISLDPDALAEWSIRIPPDHLSTMRANQERSSYAFLPEATHEFILLHTLSHLLIRQLSFECGYSSSSLAERLYCDPETGMAGLLIYTASADSEGALGGLVREGLPERLYGTFKSALFRATWCSNDPICSEMPHQGVQGLNKAACHACSLVAETSCDHANSLLDRGLVLGGSGKPSIGYFRTFIENIEESLG